MKKFFLFLLVCSCISVSVANAASRTANTINRTTNTSSKSEIQRSQPSLGRATIQKTITPRTSSTRNTSTNRLERTSNTKSRSAKNTSTKTILNRSATRTPTYKKTRNSSIISRSATNQSTNTFDAAYTNCQEAYFSCMDQFCATLNDTYRRCVCSSKLKNIQQTESKISQTQGQLEDFKNVNIDAISKTSEEVKAMSSATAGENAIKKDKSSSSLQLQNITEILDKTKQDKSLQGSSDISSNIQSIWSTTNLIGGADISTLTGESLYNAVHSQCLEAVQDVCENSANLKMVTSAYGMYIENDCSLLEKNLNKQVSAANASINATEHEMQDKRLENYNAHNSLGIKDCISKVKQSITQDTACGKDYVHCLDTTGRYLNITTGEPILTSDFYQLANLLSMDGDILKNSTNQDIIYSMNKKKSFAQQSLDLCKDKSEQVWQEFLRQSLVEIYQSQQKIVQQVKQDCLQTVNVCYADKSNSLNDFSSQVSNTQKLILSEEMCADKLDTCSNLYGGGKDGLQELVSAMKKINDLTIEQSCSDLLKKYVTALCTPTTSEAMAYPYSCSSFIPGDLFHAKTPICNQYTSNPKEIQSTQISTRLSYNNITMNFYKPTNTLTQKYKSCRAGYYLYQKQNDECNEDNSYCALTKQTSTDVLLADKCQVCPQGWVCTGGTTPATPTNKTLIQNCGDSYVGSLLQKMVIYAIQNCTRNGSLTEALSDTILSDVGSVLLDIKTSMTNVLSDLCSTRGGVWVNRPFVVGEDNSESLLQSFYQNTKASTEWGFCIQQ